MAGGKQRARAACAALALVAAFAGESALAAFPGEPGPIVYRKTITREGGAGRMETSGGIFVHGPRLREAPRQLTFEPTDHRASFSADGRKVVFQGLIDRHSSGIYVMNRDGSERRLVTDDGAEATFFPDSRRIVFPGFGGIFSIRIDGTGRRRLTSDGPYEDRDPVVSPDGRTVAFVRNRRGKKGIFVVSSGGGKARALIDGPGVEEDPEYSPDGRRLAFTGNRAGCGSGIYVARADGSHIERLTPCAPQSGFRIFNHPAFSPDGRHLVALRHSSRTAISLIRSDGGGVVGTIDSARKRNGLEIDVDIPSWGPQPR